MFKVVRIAHFSPENVYITILILLSPSSNAPLGTASLILRFQVLGFHLSPNALGQDNIRALFHGYCLLRYLLYLQADFECMIRIPDDSVQPYQESHSGGSLILGDQTIDDSGIPTYVSMRWSLFRVPFQRRLQLKTRPRCRSNH